jgi:RasGEF domain/RasGEF N-terminal motif
VKQERTSCLSRDSPLIVSHVGLRRLRKGLLSDLSMLVRIAKQLQDAVQTCEPESIVYELLDELILKAFKVVERAVRFHDIWNQDVESENTIDFTTANNRPLTPPAESNSDTQSSVGAEQSQEPLEGPMEHPALPREPMQEPEIVKFKPEFSHISNEMEIANGSGQDAFVLSQLASRPLSISATRISVSHRLSYIGKGSTAHMDNLASERLSAAYDSFTSLLGIFLGLHIKSRSSHELAATTHRSVLACRQLIAVVEEIWARDGRRQDSLQVARDVMYARLAELVKTTKDMLTTAQNDDVLDSDQGQQLVLTTTSCILAAGDCVSKARQTIERIGDFEFEASSMALSDQIFSVLSQNQNASPSIISADHVTIERSGSSLDKPLPIPPEPSNRPPPPPLTLNIDSKPLPKPPQLSPLVSPNSSLQAILLDSPEAESLHSSGSSIPPQSIAIPLEPSQDMNVAAVMPSTVPTDYSHMPRTDSVNASVTSATDTNSTWRNSVPDGASVASRTSTRATTPEGSPHPVHDGEMMQSVGSISELQSVASEESTVEEQVLETTYAHELIPSKDGQVLGGSLPALIERLSTHDSTPDATFVTTFYLTFRLFTTPVEFAQGLVDRFDYIGDSQAVGLPVRLRIYNVFKQWLETHWQPDTDSDVLPIISDFANNKLALVLRTVATRLLELVAKVSERGDRAICPRIVSALGKTGTSVTSFSSMDSQIPTPNVTKSQLNALRAARVGGASCNILDFDPLELARQFTIIESRIFCSIGPEELLALEWTKKLDSRAVNVRAMSTLSTDLANLVADTILQFEETKKRAVIIKHWVKIAMKCLELNNFDSLMAIICSLNSSMVLRLKKTWDLVSQKTKARLEELCAIVDVGKNYYVLRERLKDIVAPCIPFVGLYLTDLTFVHAGNPATRELPGIEPKRYVINFDRYIKTAKTIGQLQRFQVPYRLAAVPELQEWMEAQIVRIRESDSANVQNYYRRSLLLEPRETQNAQGKTHWYSTQSNNQQAQQQQLQQQQLQQQAYQQQSDADQFSHRDGHSSKESVGGISNKEKFDLFSSFSIGRNTDPKIGSP